MQLYVLILVVSSFGFVSVWRVLRTRFPHPADVTTISVLYYSVPLAAATAVIGEAGTPLFLHAAAADRGIAMQSMAYVLLALCSLQLGRWYAARMSLGAAHLEFPISFGEMTKMRLAIICLVGAIVLGVAIYGSDIFLAGYSTTARSAEANQGSAASGNALIYASIELLGLVIAYLYIASRANASRFLTLLVLAAMVFLITLAAVRGKRLEVVSAFLPLGVLLCATTPFFRKARGRLATLGVAVLLLAALGAVRVGSDLNALQVLFYTFSEGFFAGHALPGIIDKLNTDQTSYEYGGRVIAGLLAFIPRFVWPGKDDFLYSGDAMLESVSPLGATSILADVVLQGGAIAVIIWFTTLGILFERVHSRCEAEFDRAMRVRRLPASTIGYLVLVSVFIPHFRDGLVPAIKITLQAAVFFYAIAGLRWKMPMVWNVTLCRREALPDGPHPGPRQD